MGIVLHLSVFHTLYQKRKLQKFSYVQQFHEIFHFGRQCLGLTTYVNERKAFRYSLQVQLQSRNIMLNPST